MIYADEIIRSKRKSISISVDKDGRVIVRAPKHASKKDIDSAVVSSQRWLEKHLKMLDDGKQRFNLEIADGNTVSILGEEYVFCFGKGKSRIENGIVFINVSRDPAEEFRRALKAFALEYLTGRVDYYRIVTGLCPETIRVSNAKTRWGSCTSNKTVSFSCYLVLNEKRAVDYVVVHELCHLKNMNHSPAFWADVKKYIPDYKEQKKRLNENRWLTEMF